MITVIMTIEPCIKTGDFERALCNNVQRALQYRQALIIVADIQNSAEHAEIVQKHSCGVAAYLGVPHAHGINMSAYARNMAASVVRNNRILFIDADCSLRETTLRYHDRQSADILVGPLVSEKWIKSRGLKRHKLYLKGDPRERIAPISTRQLDIYACGYAREGAKYAPRGFVWVENLSMSADIFCSIGGFWEYAAPGELGYDIACRVEQVYHIKPGIHFSAAVDFPRGHIRRPSSKQKRSYELAFSAYQDFLPSDKKSVPGAYVSTFLPVYACDQVECPEGLLELIAAFPSWNSYTLDARWAFPKPENGSPALSAKDLDAIVGKVSREIEIDIARNFAIPAGFTQTVWPIPTGGWAVNHVNNPYPDIDDDDDDDEGFEDDEDEYSWGDLDDYDDDEEDDDLPYYDDYDDDEDDD